MSCKEFCCSCCSPLQSTRSRGLGVKETESWAFLPLSAASPSRGRNPGTILPLCHCCDTRSDRDFFPQSLQAGLRTLPLPSAGTAGQICFLAATGDLYVQLPGVKRLIINFYRSSPEVIFPIVFDIQPCQTFFPKWHQSFFFFHFFSLCGTSADVLPFFQGNKSPRGLVPDFIPPAGFQALLAPGPRQDKECELCQTGTGLTGISHPSGFWIKHCSIEDEESPAQGGFLPALQDLTQQQARGAVGWFWPSPALQSPLMIQGG